MQDEEFYKDYIYHLESLLETYTAYIESLEKYVPSKYRRKY